MEAYCNDINCDCRRVFFNVISRKRQKVVAVVTFGWEDEAFYRKWFGGRDGDITRITVSEMAGVSLNSMSPQSEIAPALLEPIRDILQADPAYVERLKSHYRIFKERIDPKHFRPSGAAERLEAAKPKSKKRKRH